MLAVVGFGDRSGTQPLGLVQRMCHRRNIGGVGLAQLVDEIDDPRQFVDSLGELLAGEVESRQHRNVLNLFFIE